MKLHVLNPVAEPQTANKESPAASKLPNLEGKLIGLYWNHKAGGDAALKRAGELLKTRYTGLETRSYVGSIGGAIHCVTKEDVKRMAQECAAVIGSTAD